MFALTGITGQVGGETARALLATGKQVRAVVRDAAKGNAWRDQGCEVTVADMADVPALTRAFSGVEGVFVLLPPVFDPAPGMPEVIARIDAIRDALAAAKVPKVVALSTIGAQAAEPNLLSALGVMEKTLRALPMPTAFLRAAWFMENSSWDVASARNEGVVRSFLQPLDKPVPMVATRDVGRLAAEMLQESWSGSRVVELEGPVRIPPLEIGAVFGRVMERAVTVEVVARQTWEQMFLGQGMKNPGPRMRMLDGFNEGWIEFEGEPLKGTTTIEEVLRRLV